MACVTPRTSRIVYVLFHLISSLVICANADVITNCSNAATCIRTYADIYNSLASDENSFNISSALYPANEPSSVLVFVNISGQSGPDKTGDNGVRKYTWSLRSLYAAFPAVFLEISSLSSIMVTARTRNLTITIPYFCCNVSEEDRNKRIKDVLAALQDLAVMPNLRDPRLNFAESVIEGHTPDINTTGRSHLKVVLWFSFLSPMILGPFLHFLVLQYLKDVTENRSLSEICCRKEKPLIRSVTIFCCVLLLIEVIFVSISVIKSTEISRRGNFSGDFYALTVLIPEWLIICCFRCLCCKDLDISSFFSRLLLIMCTSFVCYHFSWVAMGIMVNPAWGVSILLVLSLFFITLFFVIHETTHADDSYRLSTFFAYTPGFLGLCVVVLVPPLLVGQSFYGRETADDILKAALLPVIGAVSWLSFKSHRTSSDTSQVIKAAEKVAAAARALAEKITVAQPDGTGVDSVNARAATATSSAAVATAVAAEAVAVALAAPETENSNTRAVRCRDENSTHERVPLNEIN